MNKATPTVSIIIPITSAATLLDQILKHLQAQTYSLQQLELIFVTTIHSLEIETRLAQWQHSFSCQVVYHPGVTLATARNHGAAAAQGQVLLFLAEELEPAPELVQAHLQTHQAQPGSLVIGPCRYIIRDQPDFTTIKLRTWWEDHFYRLAQTGHRYTYRDLAGPNFSLEASLFNRLGGFNSLLTYGETYELALRLLKANIPFLFAAGALGYYRWSANPATSFRLSEGEGKLMAFLGQTHPELQTSPFVAHFGAPSSPYHRYSPRLLYTLAFTWPAIGDRLAALLSRSLGFFEKIRLRRHWLRLFHSLVMYWYWRGVAQELGPQPGLRRFRQDAQAGQPDPHSPDLNLDISQGLAAAEALLDQHRPASIAVYYGQHHLGDIPPQPGAEPLRGVHLRPILANQFAAPLLQALAVEQVLNTELEITISPETINASLETC